MERRYTLSAHKYDEETGRARPMGIYKTEDLHSHAIHTAKLMLDTNPEAMLIEIFDMRTNKYEHYSRLRS